MDPKFQEIAKLFAKLPGIGPRAAARIVLALLDKPPQEVQELGQAIVDLQTTIKLCTECANISDDGVCSICRDSRRDPKAIMVLEKVTDLESVERAGVWRGLYHVLGGSIDPVHGITAAHIRLRELAERVDRFVQQVGTVELVLATNPTSSGEMTALYVADMFSGLPGVRTTRLARGLASGTHLEYADELTLKHALASRK